MTRAVCRARGARGCARSNLFFLFFFAEMRACHSFIVDPNTNLSHQNKALHFFSFFFFFCLLLLRPRKHKKKGTLTQKAKKRPMKPKKRAQFLKGKRDFFFARVLVFLFLKKLLFRQSDYNEKMRAYMRFYKPISFVKAMYLSFISNFK